MTKEVRNNWFVEVLYGWSTKKLRKTHVVKVGVERENGLKETMNLLYSDMKDEEVRGRVLKELRNIDAITLEEYKVLEDIADIYIVSRNVEEVDNLDVYIPKKLGAMSLNDLAYKVATSYTRTPFLYSKDYISYDKSKHLGFISSRNKNGELEIVIMFRALKKFLGVEDYNAFIDIFKEMYNIKQDNGKTVELHLFKKDKSLSLNDILNKKWSKSYVNGNGIYTYLKSFDNDINN